MKIHPIPLLPCVTANAGNSRLPDIQPPAEPKVVAYHQDDKKPLQYVESIMNYCAPEVTKIQIRRGLDGTDSALEGAAWDFSTVKVHNARLASKKLDPNGFQLVTQSVRSLGIDFTDTDNVIDQYYPQCEQLLKDHTGASQVYAFDHNIRVSGSHAKDRTGTTNLQQPVGVVHNDYTAVGGPRRLESTAQFCVEIRRTWY